jgi:sorting nexin-29
VKQGEGLSTVLFNLALHQAIDKVNQRGTIYFKSSQICAYAVDIVIVARNISTLKQIYLEMEKEAERFGLVVKEWKTKYMVMSTSSTKRTPQSISIGNRAFEGVSQFRYLGALVNSQNEISDCINDKIQKGNRAHFANQNFF